MNSATRFDKQRAMETDLHRFCPDAVEAQELLIALIAGLEGRYDAGQLADVMHEYRQLLGALDELERTTCKPTEIDPMTAYKDSLFA